MKTSLKCLVVCYTVLLQETKDDKRSTATEIIYSQEINAALSQVFSHTQRSFNKKQS